MSVTPDQIHSQQPAVSGGRAGLGAVISQVPSLCLSLRPQRGGLPAGRSFRWGQTEGEPHLGTGCLLWEKPPQAENQTRLALPDDFHLN